MRVAARKPTNDRDICQPMTACVLSCSQSIFASAMLADVRILPVAPPQCMQPIALRARYAPMPKSGYAGFPARVISSLKVNLPNRPSLAPETIWASCWAGSTCPLGPSQSVFSDTSPQP